MTRTTRDVLVGFLAAGLAMFAALQLGGSAPAKAPPNIPDPGRFVGWAVPSVTVLTELSVVALVGFLMVAVFLLPGSRDDVEGLAVDAVRLARRWAIVWSLASLALFVLTVSDVFGRPLGSLNWILVSSLAFETSLGRALLIQSLAAALLALALGWTLSVRPLALILGASIGSLIPVALTGHASSAASHDLATTSLFLHISGVTVWMGGLAALAWVAIRGSKRLDEAVARYSTLALWAYVVVAASGIANASVRLLDWSDVFGSPYGRLVVGKALAIVLLGVFGWSQRRRIMVAGGRFLPLAISELMVMAATVGLAVALSRTATPASDKVVTTAEDLIGGPMPPPPDVMHLMWGWAPTGVGLAVVGLGTALYVKSVLVLRSRGDSWPVGRSISWGLGMLVVYWAAVGGLAEYSHVLFSAHMVSHMMLSMVGPIFLVLGAPMTLALRTLPGPRRPGEVSPRAMLLAFLHSRFSRFVTHPLVGPVLFTGSLYGLYFTGAFEGLMGSHWGHAAMQLHFIGVGTLYYYVLIGVDPSPRRLAPIVRFGLLLVTVPFHAFFAIGIMSDSSVIAGGYYRAIDRPFRTDLLADQYLGGGIAWAMGEIPLVLVMLAILVAWYRSDAREAKRYDRSESRTGDEQLEAYNARLRDLAEHGKRRDP
ncbi:cytochrome c oxidase assembly protein [Aeromicrobium sp.]|uniref:cytochrome c oxidase assembly protein n=1 Tax=Aeromicrobium sp. TaxID=1871063 RepID=UPI003C4549B2